MPVTKPNGTGKPKQSSSKAAKVSTKSIESIPKDIDSISKGIDSTVENKSDAEYDSSKLAINVVVDTNLLLLQGQYDYSRHEEQVTAELQNIRTKIFITYKTTLDNIILMGRYFNQAKQLIKYGDFENWITEEFTNSSIGISRITAYNWMRVDNEVTNNPTVREAFANMQLSAIYELCSFGAYPVLKEAVTQAVIEGNTFSKDNIRDIKRLHVQVIAQELEIAPELQVALSKAYKIDEAVLPKISKLSKKKQREIASAILQDTAESVKDIYNDIIRPQIDIEAITIPNDSLVELDRQTTVEHHIDGAWYDGITKIDSESLDLAIVEAPMKYDWRDSAHGLKYLCQHLDNALAPGGFAIVTMGHKSITGAEPLVDPLKVLHLLVLRRQPGQSRSIVGINIVSASIPCLLLYKPPYRVPSKMIVDLQTWSGSEDGLALEGGDEVVSGIEQGFAKFMTNVLTTNGRVGHIICSENDFHIRQHLLDVSKEVFASSFVSIG